MIRPAFILAFIAALIGLSVSAPARADERSDALNGIVVPDFHEEAEDAGITHSYQGGWEFFVGGGGSSLDCNADGLPDVVLAGGTNPAELYINRSEPGGAFSFDKGDLGIDDRLASKVLGAYALDIDGDKVDDLVLLRLGENLVLKGLGDCRFERTGRSWGIDGGHSWTTAFAAEWEPGNRFPTLAFGNYVDRTAPGSPWGTCSDNYLMRPGKGEVPDYSDTMALTPGYCALSMLFTDWNRSGEPALRIANDRQYYRGGEEQMWRIEPNRPPRLYRRADGWAHLSIWGMGITAADLNSDGLPEYAITSMGDTKLQTLDDPGDPSYPKYVDIAFERGATASQPYTGPDKLPSTGWHSEFADFNNDGRVDLFIAKGNVSIMTDFASFDPDDLLLQNVKGKFIEAGDRAGLARNTTGRGAIVDDFNRDGMLDLLVVNREANVSLFRNMGVATDWGHKTLGNWVEIKLQDENGNSAGVGSRLLVKTGTVSMNRTIGIGGGHASGHSGPIHFGLGQIDRASVRVQWPDGSWSADYTFLANTHVVIKRGAPLVAYRLIGDGS